MRSVPSSILALILLAAAGSAQDSPDYRVEGTVIDADTGKPLENVKVQVGPGLNCCGARPAGSVLTPADGTFSIALKNPYQYLFGLTRDGYVSDYSQTIRQCSPCKVTLGLHAEAKVRGRVVAGDPRSPMPGIIVDAVLVSDALHGSRSRTIASLISNPNGIFSFRQLPPGQYYFRFTPRAVAASLIVPDDASPMAKPVDTQWWPGGDATRNATPFVVTPGMDFTLPDVWLPPVGRFEVSGIIRPAACQDGDSYTVEIAAGIGAEPLRSEMVHCGAKFAFQDLNPGAYRISLVPKDQTEAMARVEVVVKDRNVNRDLPPVQSVR